MHVGGGAVAAPVVLDSWVASIKFALPDTPTAVAYRYQACAAGAPPICSSWRTVNAPKISWGIGYALANASAVATQGSWLKVYGRRLGFTAGGRFTASAVVNPGPASGTVA